MKEPDPEDVIHVMNQPNPLAQLAEPPEPSPPPQARLWRQPGRVVERNTLTAIISSEIRRQSRRKKSDRDTKHIVAQPAPSVPGIDDVLQALCHVVDPLTDDMIAEVAASGQRKAVKRLVHQLRRWEQPLKDDVPDSIREFLEAPIEIPSFLDPLEIAYGQKLFREHGPMILTCLALNGIPKSLTIANFSEALALSGLFNPDTLFSLLMDVIALVSLIATPQGLSTGSKKGRATMALQRLRLLQSASRYLLTTKWYIPSGEPLNQADLAQIKLMLALSTIDGLNKSGLVLTEDEVLAILAVWNLVGFLLGVDTRLLSTTLDASDMLCQHMTGLNSRANFYGIELTAQLIAIYQPFFPRYLKKLPAGVMRYLMGDTMANMLQVPKKYIWLQRTLIRWLHTDLSHGTEPNKFRPMLDLMASYQIKWFSLTTLDSEKGRFELSKEVEEMWNVKQRTKAVPRGAAP